MPGSGPVSRRSCPQNAIDEGGARVRASQHSDPQRLGEVEFAAVLLLPQDQRLGVALFTFVQTGGRRQDGHERVIELAQAFAMLGGKRDRVAEAEGEGLVDAIAPGKSFALLAITMIGLPARRTAWTKCRSPAVRPARASKTNRITSQSASAASVCARMRPASVAGTALFEAGRVDDGEGEIGKPRVTLAAVAGDAGLIVDQRELPPDEPVEECRFANVRPADDRDPGAHVFSSRFRAAKARPHSQSS